MGDSSQHGCWGSSLYNLFSTGEVEAEKGVIQTAILYVPHTRWFRQK